MSFGFIQNRADFKARVLDAQEPVIVKAGFEGCRPCKLIEPTFQELSRIHPEMSFLHVDVTDPQLEFYVKQYKAFAVPHFQFFYRGKAYNSSAVDSRALKTDIARFIQTIKTNR